MSENEKILAQLQAVAGKFEELSIRVTLPEVISDTDTFRRLMQEHSDLSELASFASEYIKLTNDLKEAEEMAESGKHPSAASAYLHAGWKFLRDYVFKAGFLDGGKGWTICKTNAYGVWYKYKKARAL